MEITERQEGNILVIAVEGRIDHTGAEAFQQFTVNRINEGARSLVIDFAKTTFVASMGIRAIIVPAQEVSRVGGRFGLIGLTPQVQQLFEVAGLLTVFNTYPTLADAAADGDWA
jgi:anti-anti-sigma factor